MSMPSPGLGVCRKCWSCRKDCFILAVLIGMVSFGTINIFNYDIIQNKRNLRIKNTEFTINFVILKDKEHVAEMKLVKDK